jgi:hypothetical protein
MFLAVREPAAAIRKGVEMEYVQSSRDSKPRRIRRKHLSMSWPELWVLAATRGALGVGAGLLLAGKLPDSRRRAIGSTLFAFGVLSTIPIALRLFARAPAGEVAQRAARDQLRRIPEWLETRV